MGAKVGERCFFAVDVIIDPIAPHLVTIEDDVFFGWGARVYTHITREVMKNGKLATDFAPVLIKHHAIIGAYSEIQPGRTIWEWGMTDIHALVTHDVEPWRVVRGVPARDTRFRRKI